MRYRVTFRKRFAQDGGEADAPQRMVNAADGVILDQTFVEQFEPDNLHGEERMDEDDDFMAFGTEIWEYEIAPGREQEFRDNVLEGGTSLEIEEMDSDNMPELSGEGPNSTGKEFDEPVRK